MEGLKKIIRNWRIRMHIRKIRKMQDRFIKDMVGGSTKTIRRGRTTIIRYLDNKGRVAWGGSCAECGHWPCRHVKQDKQGFWEFK